MHPSVYAAFHLLSLSPWTDISHCFIWTSQYSRASSVQMSVSNLKYHWMSLSSSAWYKSNCLGKERFFFKKREKKERTKGITPFEYDLSTLSKFMPSWLILMHALSNVSWQLVRGQFDTITISALDWKWFASAHYDMQQGKRTNMLVEEEWVSIPNSCLLDKHGKKKNACQNIRGRSAHQCRTFIMFPVQSELTDLMFPVISQFAAVIVIT